MLCREAASARFFLLAACWLLPASVVAGIAHGDDDAAAFFADKVRPLLEQRCLRCHSHAAGMMKGGLALDWRSGWASGGDSGPAIVPGKPDESLLISAVRREGLEMPPGDKLPDDEVAVLVNWVKQGATDPRKVQPPKAHKSGEAEWWSFRPLVRPTPPPGDAHSIDAFIRAKLNEHGLCMAPEADRRTLARRLSFDLHGLPPAPAEVESFVQDADPRAYEKLVDRLLASPRYGERMARLWLDVAHYGESNGYGMDRPRMNAWPYRDYVVQSYNDDKPFARFVREQIAADALFPDEPGLTPALGFIAAGPFNQSALVEQVDGTLCKKIALNLDRDDMVSTVAASFLGLTIHCARCHDHKFDPISMRDYYSMQAVFAGVVRGDRDFDDDVATSRERKRWLTVRKRLEAGEPFCSLDAADQEILLASSSAAEPVISAGEQLWQPLGAAVVSDSTATKIVMLPDDSVRFEGTAADKDTYVLVARTPLESVAAVRVEVLTDDMLPQRGPGRNPQNGNLHLSEIRVIAAPLSAPEKAVPIKIRTALADFNQAGWDVAKAIDGRADTAWGIHPQEGQSHQAAFVFDKPVTHPGGTLFTIRLEQLHGEKHLIGRLRLSAASQAPGPAAIISPDVVALVKAPATERTSANGQRIAAALSRQVIEQKLASPAPRKVYAVGSDLARLRNYGPPKEPRPIHILRRGDVAAPLAEVAPGALSAVDALSAVFTLAKPQDEAARRAALAEWIVDARNPLAWRSIVNRVWLWNFDRGLVDTPNDFGRMGSLPSHPELLDWLACEFRDTGGSIKGLQRLIVTSAAYRQASTPNPDSARQDNDNRLFWRMNRRRIDAEQLRDALLAISGKLDLTMGGPPAMQFGYSDPNPNVSPRIDYEGFDPDRPESYRRGIYRFLFRNVNDPLLEAFDSANPSLSTPKRDATITALQTLSMLNNKFVLRQCEHLSARLERETADPAGQIDLACRLLYARGATDEEKSLLAGFARQHGLVHVCRVLFNTNEFLFIP